MVAMSKFVKKMENRYKWGADDEWEIGYIVRVWSAIAILILQPYFMQAQKRNVIESVIEYFADNHEEPDESSMEAILEHLEYFRRNPVKINVAGRNELNRLGLLSEFQIESILDYRANSGDILSATELSLLNGFNNGFVESLGPFISFIQPVKNRTSTAHRKDITSQLYFKSSRQMESDTTLIGSPYYLQMKYKFKYGNLIEGGITLENDAGEALFAANAPFIDFASFHVAINDFRKINTLVIGDFSARFGQGLTIWNGFSIYGATNPMMLHKRGDKVQPYTSSEENNFYRGIAASLSFGRFDVAAFVSCNRLDAVISEGKYTSIPTGGLHNTESSFASRKKMKQTVAGINLQYLLPSVKLELSAIAYGYNKHSGRQIREYNKYQLYNGVWGNISASFYSVIERFKIFGEMAFDYGASYAALLGASFPLTSKWEAGILLRSYSKSYIAPHASAYSSISTVSNQSGIVFQSSYSFNSNLWLYLETEFVHYPWKRYNIESSSSMARIRIKIEHSGEAIKWSAAFSEKYTSHNGMHRIYGKTVTQWNILPYLTLKGTMSGVVSATAKSRAGFESGINIRYVLPTKCRIILQTGGAYFNCRNWECRLYRHEPDMPYTYNSRLLYGEGGSFYLLAGVDITDRLELYAKGDAMQYISSGKDPKSRIRMAVKYKF